MSRFFEPLIQRRTYLETFDLLLDLVMGVVWFSVFTTLVATGLSLLITCRAADPNGDLRRCTRRRHG